MTWATTYIKALQLGFPIKIRPHGNSMKGKIESGQLCTIVAVNPETLEAGDIVLCHVKGRDYLHLIHAINDDRFLIGNNRGYINGWITSENIFGKCVDIGE